MDRFEGPARLEWWANKHTCLGSIDVHVIVVTDNSGWHASAAFASPLTDEDREAWVFVMGLSPCFTLRFQADVDAVIDVCVDESEHGKLTLTAA
ncbi:hypothetical protein ACQP1W_50885 [Spirillospora sp. CA-255316]